MLAARLHGGRGAGGAGRMEVLGFFFPSVLFKSSILVCWACLLLFLSLCESVRAARFLFAGGELDVSVLWVEGRLV